MSTPTAPWLLVARREVMVKLRDKAFIGGTLLTLAVIVGIMVFQVWQSERHRDVTLLATPDAVAMAQSVADQAPSLDDKLTVIVEERPDAASARTALEDGSGNGWLHRDGDAWVLTGYDEHNGSLAEVVTTAVQQDVMAANAERAGTTMADLSQGAEVRQALLKLSLIHI